MSRCIIGVVAVVLLAAGPAAADLPAPPELPPPPTIQQKTAPGFNLAKRMAFWYEMLKGRGCILSETDAAGALRALGVMISNHRDQTEQAVLLAYYNNHVLPHANARLAGVPGFGTWKELADRKNESFAWLAANLPTGPADTAEQAKAYVAAYLSYRTRANQDHAFATALIAASTCHGQDSAPTGSPQGVNGFTSWAHMTTPQQLESTLAVTREKLVPQRIDGESDALRLFEDMKTAKLDSVFAHGKVLKAAYGSYGQLEKGKANAERMTWFATLYEGERAAAMAVAPKRVAELQTTLAALIVKLIPAVKPAKAVGGAPASTAKTVLSGKAVLTVRATSPTRTADKVTSDERSLSQDRVLVRTYKVAFTAFDVQWVTAARDYWIDVPGLPVKDVCTLKHATLRRYTKGVDVQLNKWLVENDDVLSPMLCKEKSATSSLP